MREITRAIDESYYSPLRWEFVSIYPEIRMLPIGAKRYHVIIRSTSCKKLVIRYDVDYYPNTNDVFAWYIDTI